ncbi:MAG: dihydropteroate synthase [Candidatus Omnitrophica bacterium]|nr:dihydropteroate synthase [Candidatus Omnitrophota bacterium]
MLIIGERLNPAGKPALASAIREGNAAYIQKEALAQERAGAEALDIHASLADVKHVREMQKMVEAVRAVSQLPLVIDSRDFEIVAAGLPAAGSGASINSPVDRNKPDARLFSLAKEFNAEVFFLPLNQNRIPATSDEHIAASSFILKRFEDMGIPRARLVVDAMLLALKEAKGKVTETLERIQRLKIELGVRTVIGLSNISYGLKNRGGINARFLKLAKGAGLDFVICDPLQKEVMRAAKEERNALRPSETKEFLEFAETCGP